MAAKIIHPGLPSNKDHAAYMRAILFGVGAAILGMIIYATFTIVTGLIVGYVSLGVGWMVGTAMKKGSRGVGGRRYQIAAALLTYAAVSMAAVSMEVRAFMASDRDFIAADRVSMAADRASMSEAVMAAVSSGA